MTEGLADIYGRPTDALVRLYAIWSNGGAGMLLSGNIHIDADHLERPGNVILDRKPDAEMQAALQKWTKAATQNGNHFWAQISHSGRQTQTEINPHPKAPSAIKLNLPGGKFGQPIALTEPEIDDIINRFVMAAKYCRDGGFTGVQIHAAHGYLISQFLSPRSNIRTDDWGGVLENRARILLAIVAETRKELGKDFPICVKLNSADFQRGGFAFEDSIQVAKWLEALGVDLIEISGGTYEQPKLLGMQGLEEEEPQNVAASTAAREAYFVDFAKAMQAELTVPLMVTGGFRSRAAMEQAINSGAANLIGLGRPLCYQPDGPQLLLNGAETLPRIENDLALLPRSLSFLKSIKTVRALDGFATQFWFYSQLYALGQTGKAAMDRTVFQAFREVERTHKKWLSERRNSA